jgi:hypothetical protein
MHVSACFWAFSDSNTALLLKGGSACLSQSSAGQMDGADDGVKMGTSGLLSESYFSNLRARSRHHRPPKADPSRQRPSKHDKPRGRIAGAVNATAKQWPFASTARFARSVAAANIDARPRNLKGMITLAGAIFGCIRMADDLRQAFEKNFEETEDHVEHLETVPNDRQRRA